MLLFGVVVPVVGVLKQQPALKDERFERSDRIALAWNGAVSLALMGGTVLGAWWWREGSLDGLGLGPPRLEPDALWVAAAFVAAWGLQLVWRVGTPERLARTRARWERDTPFMPRTLGELPHFAALALAAGIFEEILFRGLLVSYAAWYTGSALPGVALAVALPALVFGLCHLYQGPAAAAFVALMAVAMGAIYLRTGSLWIPMLLHAAMDLAAGWLGVRLILAQKRGAPPAD